MGYIVKKKKDYLCCINNMGMGVARYSFITRKMYGNHRYYKYLQEYLDKKRKRK